jgi:F-type H+-transporting ATPase subunit b
MKSSGSDRNRYSSFLRVLLIISTVLLLFSISVAMGASEEGGHGAEPTGWVMTDTYRVMNFAVLFIALFLVLRKPVSQALSGRIQGIKNQLEDLEAKKKAAEKSLSEYNEKIALLDKEAEQLMAQYIRQGEEAKARILDEAESMADKLKEQARKNIEHEFEQAKKNLQAEIVERALEKAEQIISERITADDQNKLVDEYLEKVVA